LGRLTKCHGNFIKSQFPDAFPETGGEAFKVGAVIHRSFNILEEATVELNGIGKHVTF
jgi:hypothetical protein